MTNIPRGCLLGDWSSNGPRTNPAVWLIPTARTVTAEYWVTRRSADAAPGYDLGGDDIRVRCKWVPDQQAWLSGSYWTRQGDRPAFACKSLANGWRIEDLAE